MADPSFTRIATLVNVRGIRGEMKAIAHTDMPEFYVNLKQAYINKKKELEPIKIQNIRLSKGMFLIAFKNISSRDEAKEYKGCDVFVPDEELAPKEEDEFFVHDLLGSSVFDKHGEMLGVVESYFDNGVHGVCEVRGEEGPFLFPMTSEIALNVSPEEKRIIIDPPEGLLELNKKPFSAGKT